MLWKHLRGRRLAGFKFRRQFPVSGFLTDFVCLDATLVIEVDGGQHGEQVSYDLKRSEILALSGFRVLRFWNNDVLQNLDAVLAEIISNLETPPSPQPSPASGRGG